MGHQLVELPMALTSITRGELMPMARDGNLFILFRGVWSNEQLQLVSQSRVDQLQRIR